MATTLINNSSNSNNADDSAPPPPPPAVANSQAPRPIRFVNNEGHPPSKRRRINAACLTCRRRKTRCDGERPRCSTCIKNRHRCLGYPEDKRDSSDVADAKLEHDEHRQADEEPTSAQRRRPSTASNVDPGDEKRSKKKPRPPAPPSAASAKLDPEDDRRSRKNPRAAAESQSQSQAQSQSQNTRRPTPATSSTHRHAASTSTPSSSLLSGEATSPAAAHRNPRATTSPQVAGPNTVSSFASQPEDADSPTTHRTMQTSRHRVPYFRYFGPTAIVPGFKQMVVSVRDRRRSTNGSISAASPMSNQSAGVVGSTAAESDIVVEEPPAYDTADPGPVHPLIISLAKTFFAHLGCNYPFLQQRKFMAMVKEKRAEPILVDAVCALAARFSDSPMLTGGNDRMPRTERGSVFAQRAKRATVDTFACPTVGAVQACLLMAYEGFGANQDSALWMYLGLAIRMALDMGLQKRVGIQYQGDSDPWLTQQRSRVAAESASPEDAIRNQPDTPSRQEQRELEQERIDTFWAVFVLDRVISSGTGRPVTLRDDGFELAFPKPVLHADTQWPTPFPVLVEIVHLSGNVSDVLNNIHDIADLTQDMWQKLMDMEGQLTKVYKNWDARLQFNVINFKAYLSIGQGTNFILLHLWFHALFIILHQPTLLSPFGELRSELQLLPDSRELSMSSAKTICDILAFADLIDPRSFTGNPFTSQPMYIAACAFLMESSATVSHRPSRESSPSPRQRSAAGPGTGRAAKDPGSSGVKKSRHSLLASAANQNYQRCYSSLEHLQTYWGGVKYILTALDQKSKGIWDPETYTSEEYESTKLGQNGVGGQFQLDNASMTSPKMNGPPIGFALAGTANSPSSSLTLMYQNLNAAAAATSSSQSQPRSGSTPPGSAQSEETARHGVREPGGMEPPPFPPAATAAARAAQRHQLPTSASQGGDVRPQASQQPQNQQPVMKVSGLSDEAERPVFVASASSSNPSAASFTSPSQQSGGFDGYSASPTSNMADGHRGVSAGASGGVYFPQGVPYQAAWAAGAGNMDSITFDSQDIDIGALGLQQPDLMGPWLDYIPGDVLGLFDHQEMGQGGQQGGGAGAGGA